MLGCGKEAGAFNSRRLHFCLRSFSLGPRQLGRTASSEQRPAELTFLPVGKLFTPDAGCNWVLTELDPDDPDLSFGLSDLGMGCPETGSVRISELEAVHGRLGLSVERDLHFSPRKTLSAYADEAWVHGAIKA